MNVVVFCQQRVVKTPAGLSIVNLAILRLIHILVHAQIGTLVSLLVVWELNPLKALFISFHLERRTSRAQARGITEEMDVNSDADFNLHSADDSFSAKN
ncbi:LOW QUALITY PROTEIN: hypothetical protein MXB_433 [Myxobolus squamalis]|nr:LOW QUALITY PROTEIN: hypothetical protein MXB_433 [Myxobolus squamalis]